MEKHQDGLNQPPYDEVVDIAGSKFALVLVASKRARQITSHQQALEEGTLEHVGPTVKTKPGDKSLTIALREVAERRLEVTAIKGRGDGESLPIELKKN